MSVWHRTRLSKVTGFGDRLRSVVDQMFDNQMEACIAFGISSPQLLRRYFTGMIVPSGSVLAAIASCGVNVNWLLTGKGELCSQDEAGTFLMGYLANRCPDAPEIDDNGQVSFSGALSR
ncbi:MAG: hypothetical protein FGM24_04530 [Candidatus Kapabacteria bacterium]|nr:hypothetical protein [Candidatus Kapabacteria bacterium]